MLEQTRGDVACPQGRAVVGRLEVQEVDRGLDPLRDMLDG